MPGIVEWKTRTSVWIFYTLRMCWLKTYLNPRLLLGKCFCFVLKYRSMLSLFIIIIFVEWWWEGMGGGMGDLNFPNTAGHFITNITYHHDGFKPQILLIIKFNKLTINLLRCKIKRLENDETFKFISTTYTELCLKNCKFRFYNTPPINPEITCGISGTIPCAAGT